ncbi:Cullin repeat-like-containing domain protein [Mycena capillaripes]|nr:Cullin repeat-like-containing domain protein [Mycena capillaripes]
MATQEQRIPGSVHPACTFLRKPVYPIEALIFPFSGFRSPNGASTSSPLQPPLTAAILRLVAAQLDGASIDQALFKKVVDLFVSLGLDATDPNKECLDVYKEQFEAPFLAATETYYSAEAEAFLNAGGAGEGGSGNIPEYLKKAEGRLREEEERVVRYLHAKTRMELRAGGQALLDYDTDEDLQRMYALLARIPEGLELRCKLEAHVKAAWLGAVSTSAPRSPELLRLVTSLPLTAILSASTLP